MGISAAKVDGWFQGADPWPCISPAQLALLRRLEDRFHPLEVGNTRVGFGVATGADRVFITRDPEARRRCEGRSHGPCQSGI
ncbi:MAG: hypothetical protein ACYC6M_15670 [Terriglobales bacterium]